MKKTRKALLLGVCAVLLVTASVLGTMAYLTATTDTITNTFTVGKVAITLDETKGGENREFKMVPDNTIDKDPKVTVKEGSEDCYLFVRLEKSNNFDDFLTYEMAVGWEKLEGVDDVYYREVTSADMGKALDVLKDNQVKVLKTVTNEMMEQAKNNQPTLKITAYACQKANVANAAEAWKTVNPTTGA